MSRETDRLLTYPAPQAPVALHLASLDVAGDGRRLAICRAPEAPVALQLSTSECYRSSEISFAALAAVPVSTPR
jgi:hypothetical protein